MRDSNTDNNMIKEAEQNVINVAKAWEDAMSFCRVLESFGGNMCHDWIARDKFFKGLNMLRDAMYNEYTHAISQCFTFVGVGGEDATNYSREMFKEAFSEENRASVMQFLDKNGRCPGSWRVNKEDEFRGQAKVIIEDFDEGVSDIVESINIDGYVKLKPKDSAPPPPPKGRSVKGSDLWY